MKKKAEAKPIPHLVSGDRIANGKTRNREVPDSGKVSAAGDSARSRRGERKEKKIQMIKSLAIKDGEDST
ncbi:MAG TPA: hypothetical protein PLU53_02340 [Bacteroidia bacterium]|nr:hypothetical protein [Bacteroidia bacterium]